MESRVDIAWHPQHSSRGLVEVFLVVRGTRYHFFDSVEHLPALLSGSQAFSEVKIERLSVQGRTRPRSQ